MQQTICRLRCDLYDSPFQQVVVLGEIMYLSVFKLGQSHAQRQTRGIADVAAQRTVIEDTSAQKGRSRYFK